MIVIGNHIFHLHSLRPLRILPLGSNHQPVSVLQPRLGFRRLEEIHAALVVRSFRAPPRFAQIEYSQHDHGRNGHHTPRASRLRGRRRLTRLQTSLTRSRSGDKHQPNREEHHQEPENPSQGSLHRKGPLRKRRHGHRKLSFPLAALDRNAHLQRAKFHQPQISREELRIFP